MLYGHFISTFSNIPISLNNRLETVKSFQANIGTYCLEIVSHLYMCSDFSLGLHKFLVHEIFAQR